MPVSRILDTPKTNQRPVFRLRDRSQPIKGQILINLTFVSPPSYLVSREPVETAPQAQAKSVPAEILLLNRYQ